ncbi:DUF1440 domain-containing protein [Blastococcus capsensis]|uniref:DUF1440 domain-containing protein n=1 Tax=Blastococcus capsensis TaxID=1564163 RepID=UPI002541BD74|nr:DUF1440 domain-containing protein [Blastococcus capsensis]MDK3258730.1 DUF1440 domain-containing protein [Blastococcus capsensis]
MNTKDAVADAALVGVAGFGAAKVMSKATTLMYAQQTDEAKEQEKEESYGVAYNVAAKKAAGLAGKELSDDQASKAGNAIHYGLALGWVPVYMVLRRRFGMTPFGAGTAAGMSMAVLVDEIGNPLLGFTPPPQKYPLVSHLRGLAGHLVYGLAVAGLVEAGWKLTGRR